MKTKLQNKQTGFTIIEVLIVLAIAGLIVLIVFLAVPALQRNSRNTQRKNDVSAMVGAVQEFTNNNGGKLPVAAQYDEVKANAKLSFYDPAQVILSTENSTGGVPSATQINDVLIRNYSKCSSATAATASNATRRNLVAVYHVETSGGTQLQCQEL